MSDLSFSHPSESASFSPVSLFNQASSESTEQNLHCSAAFPCSAVNPGPVQKDFDASKKTHFSVFQVPDGRKNKKPKQALKEPPLTMKESIIGFLKSQTSRNASFSSILAHVEKELPNIRKKDQSRYKVNLPLHLSRN